jgi:hypothetical protein
MSTVDPQDAIVRVKARHTGHGYRRWGLTVVATVVSTYALDAVATASGLLLAATTLLEGMDHLVLLAILAGTYVAWGAGLRVNLGANWLLLEATGTSSSAPSKAAYELAKLRTRSIRARRFAAAIGYVGTEAAKELPYYAGAYGAVILSDSVSSADAVVFLAGANLGAAVYEYGLGNITRAYLRRSTRTSP